MTNAELLDLLREARKFVGFCPTTQEGMDIVCKVRDRIDAALAAHQDSATSVVESDALWWTPSSHRAKEGKLELHVWRMSLEEWGWSTYVFLEREVGSGVCATESEAKSAAIAAAKGLK
jgi:hypothetical protein